MLKKSMVVKVYDGDLVGWTFGTLEEKYTNNSKAFEKWCVKCIDGTKLVRYIKTKYTDFKEDGCGYVLNKGFIIQAKINFNTWDLNGYAESWDDPEYFRNIFLNKKDENYEMIWDGNEFWELKNADDEREGTLFETKDIIFQ